MRRGRDAVRGRARPIITVRHPGAQVLRARSRPVRTVDRRIRRLIADLVLSMRQAGGIGLAAPQIGIPLRVLVVDVGDGPLAVVNPRLRRRAGSQIGVEGCLSIPGVYGEVRRAQRIEVEGRNALGRRVVVRGRDLLARVFQHEIDHLNGILFTDPGRLIRLRRLRRPIRRGRTGGGRLSGGRPGRPPRLGGVRSLGAGPVPERGGSLLTGAR